MFLVFILKPLEFLRAKGMSFVTMVGLCPQFLNSPHSQEGEVGVLFCLTSPSAPHLG